MDPSLVLAYAAWWKKLPTSCDDVYSIISPVCFIHPGVFTWISSTNMKLSSNCCDQGRRSPSPAREEKRAGREGHQLGVGKNTHPLFWCFPPWTTNKHPLKIDGWKMIRFLLHMIPFLGDIRSFLWCQGYLCFWPMAPDTMCCYFLFPLNFHPQAT